jgi:hypothetical protein
LSRRRENDLSKTLAQIADFDEGLERRPLTHPEAQAIRAGIEERLERPGGVARFWSQIGADWSTSTPRPMARSTP